MDSEYMIYKFTPEFFNHTKLGVLDFEVYDDTIKANCRNKSYAIRKQKEDESMKEFIQEISLHLKRQPFLDVMFDYDNLKIVTWQGERYEISEWLTGENIDFSNEACVLSITKVLSKFYNVIDQMEEINVNLIPRNEISTQLLKMYKDIVKYKDIAEKKEEKKGFDLLFLTHAENIIDSLSDKYHNLLKSALSEFIINNYKISINIFKDYLMAMHQDFHVEILNLYNLEYEVPMRQIANIIIKFVKESGTGLQEAKKKVIGAYRTHRELGTSEEEILNFYLSIPQEVWKVVKEYYSSKKITDSRSEKYLARLDKSIKIYTEKTF